MIVAKIMALGLIPAGAATLGVVVYLQHPTSEPAPEKVLPEPPTRQVAAATSPSVASPAEEPELVLSPLLVSKPPPKTRPKPPPAQHEAKVPCSGWRVLGYDQVSNGQASGGEHRVRELCDP